MQHTDPRLISDNEKFKGTGGVSEENKSAGFIPAFMDKRTGLVEVSRFKDGRIAPCHLLDGLPEDWIQERDHHGKALSMKESVISGFVRLGNFFTRSEAAELV